MQYSKHHKSKSTNQPVIVSGFVKRTTPKAAQVCCDANSLDRWFAFSQCKFNQEPEPGLVLKAKVPIWLLKRKNGTYPAWVWRGA